MLNKRSEVRALADALSKGIRDRTENLLRTDMSNMTADAKEGFIKSVKDSILDSISFRNDVAVAVVDIVSAKQKKTVWHFLKVCAAVFGWIASFVVALASVSDTVKSFVFSLMG